eukprot:COSAG04_NODE_5826_length_1483_cov_1.993497_2_plen_195_part_01
MRSPLSLLLRLHAPALCLTPRRRRGEAGGEALDDAARTLESHGLVRAARLQFTVRSAEEVERRGGGASWLRGALGAEAAARIKAAVRELYGDDSVAQPERLMLCNADGTPKHERWFWLTEAGQLLWGKNRDGSNHVLWKQLNFSAPRKQRTVIGVQAGPGRTARCGTCTISTAEGQPVVVRLPQQRVGSAVISPW